MMPMFCCSVAFIGTRLGKSWVILEERWPETYKGAVRQPYMDISERSLGKVGRSITLWSVVLNLFGTTNVHLILISEMLAAVVQTEAGACFTKCHALIVVGACLIPITWLGSPKDFWQASILAVVSTAAAVVVILVQIFLEEDLPTPTYPNPTLVSFARGFGSILFSFGGAAVFPTIQNDMSDRSQFWKSVIIGFTGILSLYLPVALVGYIKLGDAVESNVIMSVTMTPIVIVAIAMEIVNLMCTFLISSNTVYQSIEELINVPKRFGPRRCIVRAVIVILQILIGLAVPNFGKILNLIGGSLITLCTFVLPPVMYMRLVGDRSNKNWKKRTLPAWERAFLIEIIIVGVIGGVLATIIAVYDVVTASFDGNCFIDFSNCPLLTN
ncbi:amino acid transporter AVT1B-like isoform X2 [Portunus trituberculatus]|nr:amino acid transporter AVT1B-like isoform X2 [Portunus trituberculatus]